MYQNESNTHTSTEFNLSCTFGMLVGNFLKRDYSLRQQEIMKPDYICYNSWNLIKLLSFDATEKSYKN